MVLVTVQASVEKYAARLYPSGVDLRSKSGVKTTSRSQKQSTSDQLVVDETFA